ncbi:MAG: hypothetical protein ACRD2J_08255 [Thermoanaerobaculia bacterium]
MKRIDTTLRILSVIFLMIAAACAERVEETEPVEPPPVERPGEAPPPVEGPAAPSGDEAGEEADVPRLEGGIRLEPVDEGESNASFAAFRRQLRDIVRRRDAEALLAIVDPNIRFSFGAGGGREEFAEEWNVRSGESRLWGELGEILRLGGRFQGERFVAPYTFSAWPEGVDGFTHLAVICADAVARSRGSASSEAVARLDYHVLPIGPDDEGPGAAWRQVTLPDGREAWIDAGCVRSHVDYRAAFAPSGRGWLMEFFVAGD